MRSILAGTATAVHRCEAQGCGARAPYGRFCARCDDEIAALEQMAARQDGRESQAGMTFFHACRLVRKMLWVPMTIFVIGGLLVLGASVAPELMDWIAVGGWNQ